MLMERRERNPFDMVKASDFTDAEILDHWVDFSPVPGRGLEMLIKPRSVMPMILLGGKGSGKTHLMRYISAPVQAARHGGNLLEAMRTDRYLGVYVRAEGLNTSKFARKGQDEETWAAIFSMYFEVWLATNLLESVSGAVRYVEDPSRDAQFAEQASTLFNRDVSGSFSSFAGFVEYLVELRRHVDLIVDNAALTRDVSGITVSFSPGRLVYGLPEVVHRVYPELKSALLVYLIDEVENLTADQQRFLNTLVRYRKGNASIKIGSRLYGIRSWETLNAGEPIKRDAEYEQVELDDFLRDDQEVYADFCRRLIVSRLNFHNMRGPRPTADNVAACFAEVERENFSVRTTLSLLRSRDERGRERPYFARLRDLMGNGDYAAGLADEIISLIRLPEAPLLEKLALFSLYRNWNRDPEKLLAKAREIGGQAHALSRGDGEAASELRDVLSHFRSDLVAQLYRDCEKSSPYAGLATLIHLSQGIPRNLLSILKHIYRRSSFAGERPFEGGQISVESQSLGVKDSAAWFWDDAQPDERAQTVREAVDHLATLFRTVRFSERPSECDCATFSVRVEALSAESQRVLAIAEKWSYLIRIKAGAKVKNDRSVKAKYQLGPMLAPRWGLSEHRRGILDLNEDFADAIFDATRRGGLQDLFVKRVSDLLGKNFVRVSRHGQKQLFV